ncbi:ESX secretion-associated protein EspG [Nocardia sp. NPDC050712]|uniref:ESX secretion-associated protein EspG n=1 Tax=Nocardia sp. NPDC050712 TaxID=3155518 RepID=UPI0033C10B09
MTQTWKFTDLEFDVLCDRLAKHHIPTPLTYLVRHQWMHEYELDAIQTWERVSNTIDPALREFFRILVRPEISVLLRGWYDGNDEDPKKWIRARAVRSGMHGFIVSQIPGETRGHSGGYIVTECGPRGLAQAVVDLLPPNVEGGRHRSIPIVVKQIEGSEHHGYTGSWVSEETDSDVTSRSSEFFASPADRTGVIAIYQGHSKFGPRGLMEKFLYWRDLPDDGRYVIELPSSSPVAVGMGKKAVLSKLDDMIEAMLERAETHWE